MQKRTWILLASLALLASTTVGACGYVKVFSGSGTEDIRWGKNGYEEVTQDPDEAAVEEVAANLDALDITYAEGDSATSVTSNFTVPLLIDGCDIVWTASDGSIVTFANGVATVTRPVAATDATITLTATITRGGATATKSFDVVVKHQVSDADAVAACKETLSTSNITFSSPDTAAGIIQDFTLPATISDCTVTWTSGTPTVVVVSGTAADVTRPAFTAGDATVTLTATISRNLYLGAQDTKPLSVVVTKAAQSDAEAVAQCKAALDDADITVTAGETLTTLKNSITLPATISDCTVAWVSQNSAITNTGVVTRPANAAGDASGILTATISRNLSGGASDTKPFSTTVIRLPDYAGAVAACKAALDTADLTYSGGDTAAAVAHDITLPANITAGGETCALTWTSGDTNRVANNGTYVGPPTYCAGDQPVNLTATIKFNSDEATKGTKPLSVTVTKRSAGDTILLDKTALAIVYGGSDTASSVTQNLAGLPATGTNCSTVTWASNNTVHIPLGGSLAVNRGHTGAAVDADTTVRLTATIEAGTGGDVRSTTKDFDLTVKSLGTIYATGPGLTSGQTNDGSQKMSVAVDNLTTASDAASVIFRVCAAISQASLTSISQMDAIASSGTCSISSVFPFTIPSTSTICCTMSASDSNIRFVAPAGAEDWYFRIYAYVSGEPSEDHHKYLYTTSAKANPF